MLRQTGGGIAGEKGNGRENGAGGESGGAAANECGKKGTEKQGEWRLVAVVVVMGDGWKKIGEGNGRRRCGERVEKKERKSRESGSRGQRVWWAVKMVAAGDARG